MLGGIDLDKLYDFLLAGTLSAFGGAAAYIFRLSKTKEAFTFSMFFISAFLAFFIGNVVGSFIPQDNSNRDGFLMLCGFLAFPILGLIESDGLGWMKGFFRR